MNIMVHSPAGETLDGLVLKNMLRLADNFCRRNNWIKDWKHGGVYLHLESSEFIEALRGKGNPAKEAADVLIALLSTVAYNKIDISDILNNFYRITTEEHIKVGRG